MQTHEIEYLQNAALNSHLETLKLSRHMDIMDICICKAKM